MPAPAPRHLLRCCALLALGILGLACRPPEDPFPTDAELTTLRDLYTPPAHPAADATNKYGDDPQAIALGAQLFFDTKLSGCGTVSCSSCHQGDGLSVTTPTAQGCGGNYTGRNPPSLLNTGYGTWYMWDGRADRLWNQPRLPLMSPIEMNSTPDIFRARMKAAYASPYQALFGTSPSTDSDDQLLANFGKAIAAYERTLNRIDAPFDHDVARFLQAVDAGTEQKDPAYLGLKTFVRTAQCAICHKTPMLADDLFHNIGVKDQSAGNRGVTATADAMLASQFSAAGPYSDNPHGDDTQRLQALRDQLAQQGSALEGAFRTPTLRNIALTGPYMHTGELATLEEVVDLYDKGGASTGSYVGVVATTVKPRHLTAAEKKALVDLLKSMTGAPAQ